jgi:hypothetical protein
MRGGTAPFAVPLFPAKLPATLNQQVALLRTADSQLATRSLMQVRTGFTQALGLPGLEDLDT